MPLDKDFAWVDVAFPLPSLNKSIRQALGNDPKYKSLFKEIGDYIQSIRNGDGGASLAEPTAKKRKLDGSNESVSSSPAASASAPPKPSADDAVLVLEAISFSVPQRKKFSLVISKSGLSAVTAAGAVEFGVIFDNIDYVCCLPVPDKATKQWNFCVFPVDADGLTGSTADAIVFTVPDGAPKGASGDAMGSGHNTSSYRSLLIDILDSILKLGKSRVLSVEEPKESVFCSAMAQSHRKGEKAFHIKAHRGNKEGYLFFLQRGILWAFKKPLIYFSFGNIDSVSYTSITKRTFNLSVRVQEHRGGTEYEFSMIDQEDYPGIDEYIKARKLNDASMAEQRRAKNYHVNGKADAAGEGGETTEQDVSELEKALMDAEEEEEEDYVPGEDDEEGGSGASDSDSEDEGGSGAEDNENMDSEDDADSVDLKEELGSEMEDVAPDAPKQKRIKRVRA